jgi:hypothetical protein
MRSVTDRGTLGEHRRGNKVAKQRPEPAENCVLAGKTRASPKKPVAVGFRFSSIGFAPKVTR